MQYKLTQEESFLLGLIILKNQSDSKDMVREDLLSMDAEGDEEIQTITSILRKISSMGELEWEEVAAAAYEEAMDDA